MSGEQSEGGREPYPRILCVIPVRGGSKGVPRKNIRELAGKPLVVWTIEQALAARPAMRVIVSTDDPEIASIARVAGADVPSLRPAELARDDTSTEAVVLHEIERERARGFNPEAIMLLQATSPVRLPGTIDRAIRQFVTTGVDSLVGVVAVSPFLWQLPEPPAAGIQTDEFGEAALVAAAEAVEAAVEAVEAAAGTPGGSAGTVIGTAADGAPVDVVIARASYDIAARPRRQELRPHDVLYRETGSLYLTRTEVYERESNRLGGRIGTFVMDEREAADIDTEEDFRATNIAVTSMIEARAARAALAEATPPVRPALRRPLPGGYRNERGMQRMRIERNIAPYLVFSEDSVMTALRKIQENGQRIVFCVDAHGVLQASLSDGDFRRWVLAHQAGDLSVRALSVANRAVRSAAFGTDPAELASYFNDGVAHVPLVDERGHLVAIAVDRADKLRIGRHDVGDGKPALLIAEIGINHNGSVDLAKQLVDLAREARADIVKFQLRDMDALYRGDSSREDLGPQYTLDLLSRFSLGRDELFEVFDHARDAGIDVMCTPWDSPSVQALVDYGVPALKIASADLTNHELLRDASSRGIPLVLSTGMSRESEIRESAELMQRSGSPFAMLHCQSTYPAPFKDVNLAYMDRLAEIGQCPVGYSGHERGWHVPVAAVARGANIIEKHFTIDRGMEGNDHKVSLLPDEFSAMVSQIREIEEAMGGTEPRQVSTGEMMNRVNLAKSLIAARPIAKGQTIMQEDVAVKSPGRGLQPNALPQLLGRASRRDVEAGDFFYEADLQDAVEVRREYTFRRPWGLAVRYHDYEPLLNDSNMDFVEFHFSYKDLDLNVHEVFAGKRLPVGFTTHSPDLFAGDFLLNLASEDDEHWERSIRELQRVVHTSREIAQYFENPEDPVVVASLGGFTTDAHLPKAARRRMYDRVSAGLDRVDLDGVRLGAQTLPPFPWYMGGQLYCNLFVDAEDTAEWAQRSGRNITLDVSHTKLAANQSGAAFSECVELLAPHAVHLHLVDATGVDGEGVQIGEGEIDWPLLARQLDRLAPGVSFIPEIWQGHVNEGQGFWTALERLEAWF